MTVQGNPDTLDWAPQWVTGALPPGKFTRSIRELWADVVILPSLPIGPTARLVALVLARFMDAHGCGARPSLTTLAKHAALGRSTVKRDLAELERGGFIARDPGNPKRSTRYSAELPEHDPREVGHTVAHVGHDVAYLGHTVDDVGHHVAPSRPQRGPEVGLEVGREETKEALPGADACASAATTAFDPVKAEVEKLVARGHDPDVAAALVKRSAS